MKPYSVLCDVPGCRDGYINNVMCEKCNGNGRVILTEPPGVTKAYRLLAYAAVAILIVIAAYLIASGGR